MLISFLSITSFVLAFKHSVFLCEPMVCVPGLSCFCYELSGPGGAPEAGHRYLFQVCFVPGVSVLHIIQRFGVTEISIFVKEKHIQ